MTTLRLEIQVLPGMNPQLFDVQCVPETLEIESWEHGHKITVVDTNDTPRAWVAAQILHVSFWEMGEDVTTQSTEAERELSTSAQSA